MDEEPVDARDSRARRASATSASNGTGRSLAPSRSIASSFVARRVVRDDDRARDAQAARVPGDALRHVAGARRVDAARAALARGAGAIALPRPAELERADRLEVLELEPDLAGDRRRRSSANERRAQGGAGDALARRADLVERDRRERRHASRVPPRSTAIARRPSRRARCGGCGRAAATSSIASPSDLKSVISSAERAPGRPAERARRRSRRRCARRRWRPPASGSRKSPGLVERPTRGGRTKSRDADDGGRVELAGEGTLEPTALTCAPGASHSPTSTGSRDGRRRADEVRAARRLPRRRRPARSRSRGAPTPGARTRRALLGSPARDAHAPERRTACIAARCVRA